MMLWAAFHQHTDVPNCRMKVVPQTFDSSDDFRPDWLKKTVARFHTYYSRIFNESGAETLRSVLEDHRESLKSMDRETRLLLQNILLGVEEALLPPEEVWLTWSRNRYRSGVRKALFQRLLPKLVVRVAHRGAFGLLGNRLRADLEGEASARRLAPHITWTPEVMR
jgi:hypothetical protein